MDEGADTYSVDISVILHAFGISQRNLAMITNCEISYTLNAHNLHFNLQIRTKRGTYTSAVHVSRQQYGALRSLTGKTKDPELWCNCPYLVMTLLIIL